MVKHLSCMALILCLLMTAANGYTADTSIINVYDANGNLVTGDGRYYEYNDANQLVKVRQGVDQTGPVIAEYFYDAAGQRVKKIENGVVTYYIGKHYEKQVGGSNAGSTSYYFGEGGERVAKKDPAGNILYYHLDHLDGVNAVTDSAGTLVSRTDYLPFGDVRAGSSGSDKYSYTGKEKDKTDLYYFDARYNSPEFRHFTQADIAEPDYADPQDLNRYAYVGNNPLSYVDYDGFKKKKKAKLSKREKWMIAHGSDPDHDKTSLKKAKAQFKAGTKYTTVAKSTTSTASSGPIGAGYSLAVSRTAEGNDPDWAVRGISYAISDIQTSGNSIYSSSIRDPFIPSGDLEYGYYGGPGYCSGERVSDYCSFEKSPIDKMDSLFKSHDKAYHSHNDLIVLKADITLLLGLSKLDTGIWNEYSDEYQDFAKKFRSAAIKAFVAKIGCETLLTGGLGICSFD